MTLIGIFGSPQIVSWHIYVPDSRTAGGNCSMGALRQSWQHWSRHVGRGFLKRSPKNSPEDNTGSVRKAMSIVYLCLERWSFWKERLAWIAQQDSLLEVTRSTSLRIIDDMNDVEKDPQAEKWQYWVAQHSLDGGVFGTLSFSSIHPLPRISFLPDESGYEQFDYHRYEASFQSTFFPHPEESSQHSSIMPSRPPPSSFNSQL